MAERREATALPLIGRRKRCSCSSPLRANTHQRPAAAPRPGALLGATLAGRARRTDGAIYARDVPSDLVLKVMNGAHRLVLAASRGRLGWSAGGMPVVELTTIGRRSGQARTILLTSPYQEGSTLVVVASRGGDDRDPAWFLNLRDQPQVTVSVGGSHPRRCEPRSPIGTSGPGCGRS